MKILLLKNDEFVTLQRVIWTHMSLLVLDLIFLPCVLLVFMTGIRLPNLTRKHRRCSVAQVSDGDVFRRMNRETVRLRCSAGKEVLLLLFADIPVRLYTQMKILQ